MIYPIFGNNSITKRGDRIFLDELDCQTLVKHYDSPFFVFLEQRVSDNIDRLKNIVESVFKDFRICYSTKSNYIRDILRIIAKKSIGFSIISKFELDELKSSDISTDQLIFGSPYLTESLLVSLTRCRNPIVSVYSLNQILFLESFALKQDIDHIDILIRVCLPGKNHHLGLRIGNDLISDLKKTVDSCSRINIRGILCHFGTQVREPSKVKKNSNYAADILTKIENEHICEPDIVNMGGGLPIASSIKDKQLLEYFKIQKKIFLSRGFSSLKYIFEPGRYIVGDAGCCILSIVDKKAPKENHKDFSTSLYVDGGLHILPRFTRNPYRFYNLNAPVAHYNNPVNFYGIMLIEQDVLAKNYNFSVRTEIGDHVLVTNCGAYSHTFSNRFPYYSPNAVLINGKKHKTIEYSK